MSLENVQAAYKLTPVQQGMLLATLLAPTSGVYCDQFCFGGGAVDPAIFRAAWERIFARHGVLRTSFVWQRLAEPVQLVHRQVEAALHFEDWSGLDPAEQGRRLVTLREQDRALGFELDRAPLMRLRLIRLSADRHEIVWSYHHLLLDAWSVGLLMREAELSYEALRDGREPALPPPRPFRDYVDWQRAQDPEAAREHWRQTLQGLAASTPLPFDLAPGAAPGPRAAFRSDTIALAAGSSARLQELARAERVTLNLLVESAWALVLGRLAGQSRVVFGVTVAGRPPELKGIEQMVGCLINTLPVVAELDAKASFLELARQIRSSLQGLRRFEHSALAEVEAAAGLPGRQPLFESVLVSNTFTADRNYSSFQRTNFPLALTITPRPEALTLSLGYDRGRFEPTAMRRLLSMVSELLTAAAAAGLGVPQGALGRPSQAERHQTLREWNDRATDFGAPATLTAALSRQVAATPQSIAVEAGDEALSYQALGAAAAALASRLRGLGAGPESVVGICIERSLELEVALVAVLAAGAAYLPLDPSYPAERLAFMLEDAEVAVLLTAAGSAARLPPTEVPSLDLSGCLGAGLGQATAAPGPEPGAELDGENAAYVIFTSGSTGRPKGAVNRHAGIVNRLAWMQAAYPLSSDDRVLQKTPISFDVSVWELFWPLVVGARVVMLAPAAHRDPRALARAMAERAITTLHFVPSMLAAFLDEEPPAGSFPALRQVMASGEALTSALARRAENTLGAPLYNLYGPTEAAVDVTAEPAREAGSLVAVPIGRPIANTAIFLLGPDGAPVPLGIAGELAIGGVNLGRGYHRRPALTASRWVPAPLATEPGERLYRTGDLARHLADGRVEFLGRIDQQIKLRGQRIELGEIEAALALHPGVREGVVVARPTAAGDDLRLVAYVVARGAAPTAAELRRHLAASLPEAMVPAAFVTLAALPLSPNGKLDRKALPEPEAGAAGGGRAEGGGWQPPRTPSEELMLALWAELLGRDGLGCEDNFFEVGGHSLLVTRLLARIRDTFEVELELPEVFAAPTLAALARRVDEARRESPKGAAEPAPARRSGESPLSFAQERMWFLSRLEPASPLYNIPAVVELEGPLVPVAASTGLAGLVARHQTLRTSYPAPQGRPTLAVAPTASPRLPTVDLSALGRGLSRQRSQRLAVIHGRTPFDLEHGPVLACCLLRRSPGEHQLALSVHHIAADGWSMGVLVRDFAAFYRHALHAEAPLPAPLTRTYTEHAAEERGGASRDLAYWRGALAGAPALLALPTDRPRPAAKAFRGSTVARLLPPATAAGLEALGRGHRATFFITLLAAFELLLARHSGASDLVVGTPVAGRDRRELEELVGLFVNTLALRARLVPGETFLDLLRRTRRTVLDAFAHGKLPFEQLVEELAPERSLAHTPIFQVMLVLQNAPLPELELPGLEARLTQADLGVAKLDLTLSLAAVEGGLAATLELDRELFDPTTGHRLLGQLEHLLAAVVAAPATALAALPLLSAAERQQLEHEWNDTAGPGEAAEWLPEDGEPAEPRVHDAVLRQCRETPEAIALAFEDQALSYAALAHGAQHLAARLRSQGVGPEEVVALALERSLALPVAVLAVLLADGAWLPLDAEAPAERLALILEEARVRVVLTHGGGFPLLPLSCDTAARAVFLEVEAPGWLHATPPSAAPPSAVPPSRALAASPAYVIYTSGTTGRPKGVVNHHRGIVNRLEWMQACYGLGAGDRVLQKTPTTFDVSVWELLWPLRVGARLELARPGEHKDPRALGNTFAERAITFAHFVPSMLAAFLDARALPGHAPSLPCLRQLVASGEALPWELASRTVSELGSPVGMGMASGMGLDNLYGPTEAAVDVSRAPFRGGPPRPTVAIGRPIAALTLYVLEPGGQPAPIGVSGELMIGGVGLARGYLARPGATAERFVPDSCADTTTGGGRLYRTGDRVRALPDGNLEFLGRLDHQVKIRGLRIELGEIESVLAGLPAVEDCVVVARDDGAGPVLVAYLVPAAGATPNPAELGRELAAKLPAYMVPAVFVPLAALPLSANGKLDRKALPAPDWQQRPSDAEPSSPPSPREELIAGIFAELLGRPSVSPRASFFELGGHSLLAAQVVARVRAALGVEPPLATLFAAPSAVAFAAAIEALAKPARPRPALVARTAEVAAPPLSFGQERLWFLAELEPANAAFNLHGALALEGSLEVRPMAIAFDRLVARHEALRTTFPAAGGRPFQLLAPSRHQELPVVDLLALAAATHGALLPRLARATAAQPFALDRGPLLRTVLVRLEAERHAVLLALHHIVGDGWSLGVLCRDLAAFYRAEVEARPAALPPLPIQPADLALWQRQAFGRAELAEELDFWRQALAGAPPLLPLPTDRPRPPRPSYRGAEHRFELPPTLSADVLALARAEGATLFMALLAALGALWGRLAGRADVVLGTPHAGRRHAETEGLIGFFVQSLPLRLRLGDGLSFSALLARARTTALAAFDHAELPFDELVAELASERTLAHAPIFQAMLVLQNTPEVRFELPGLSLTRLPSSSGSVQLDCVVSFEPTPRGLAGLFDYAVELFDPTTIRRWAGHLENLLAAAVAAPTRPLAAFSLLGPAEEQQLLREWVGRTTTAPAASSVHQLFLATAAERPDTIALVMADEALSYGALDAWSGALAAAIRGFGIARDERVAVCVERSPAAVAGLLAVLRAGAAYLPLDPAYPNERRRFMLADGGARLVLTQPWFENTLDGEDSSGASVVPTLALGGHPPAAAPAVAEVEIDPDQLAYLIYTSGSSGRPKGVLVPHRGLTNMCLDLAVAWGLAPGDVHLTFNSLAFDASASNLYPVLVTGATFLLHPAPAELAGGELERLVVERAITHLDVPPAYWALWLPELAARPRPALAPTLRQLNLGGDSAALPLVRQWAEITAGRVRIFGPYGPTETTVGSSYTLTVDGSELPRGATQLPIGRPFWNTALWIVDRGCRLLPLGAAGEIVIRGVGLARGYLGAAGETAARFVPNPFATAVGERIYRTGDLGRLGADGKVEFLGRLDAQVKVRGFRIELGEIEAALGAHPGIAKAVVVARQGAAGHGAAGSPRQLVAYLVAEGEAPGQAELRDFLAVRLPAYMLPAVFVVLPELPLGPTGKVDRQALPAPTAADLAPEGEIVPPENDLEAAVVAVFAELLGRERVSTAASFFELGGHSLLATQAVSRLRATLGVELPLRAFFEAPTAKALAAELARGQAASPAADLPPIPLLPRHFVDGEAQLPVSFNQLRLWFLDQLEPASPRYNLPGALQLRGRLMPRALALALVDLARRHETLRTRLVWNGNEPEQRVSAAAKLALPVLDLAALGPSLPIGTIKERGRRLAGLEALRPFDLARGPLARARLVRLAANEHLLLLTLHHIVGDGWSLGVLVGELFGAYQARLGGRAPSLPALEPQYGDYAAWQRATLVGERLETELAFWRGELEGAPTQLDLPTDRPRPERLTAAGAALRLTLPASLTRALRERAAAQGATLFMALVAAYQGLLARLARAQDLLIGVGVANRDRLELEPLIGFFVNTLVLRAEVGDNPSLEALVAQAKRRALAVFAHQGMPFDKLVEELELPRDLSRMPLVQAAFVLQNAPLPPSRLGELELSPLELGTTTAKFDLLLALVEGGDDLVGSLEFNTDLFNPASAERFLECYHLVLSTYAAAPTTRLSEVPLFRRELAASLHLEEAAIRAFAPLAPTQRDLYLEVLRDPTATTYSLGLSLALGHGLDAARWLEASDRVLAREEVAVLRLTALRGEPYQVVVGSPVGGAPFAATELVELGRPGGPASLEDFLARRVKVPYNLAAEPLFRSFLLAFPDGSMTAVLGVQHAVADAFSGKVFFERVARRYRGLLAGDTEGEASPSFVAEVGAMLARFDQPATLAYFRTALAGVSPLEVQPARGLSPRPQTETTLLSGAALATLRGLAKGQGLSVPALLRAALPLLVSRLFEPEGDLAFAEVLGGRDERQRQTVGCFFHQLPLVLPRVLLDRATPLSEIFRWAKTTRRQRGAREALSVLAARRLGAGRGLTFVLNIYNFSQVEAPRGTATLVVHDSFPRDEVHLLVDDSGERLTLTWCYDETALAVSRLGARIVALLATLGGVSRCGELAVMLPDERQQVLRGWNETTRSYADAASLLPAVTRNFTHRAEAIAVAIGDEQLSFAALAARSARLALHLVALGAGRGTVVALALERSLELVVAILATQRAGAAYLPLDTTYPEARLRFLLVDAQAAALVTTSLWHSELAAGGPPTVHLDQELLPPPAADPRSLDTASGDELAYVIYTSGSTGNPKGAMNTHAALANRVLWMQEEYGLGIEDRVLQKTPTTFDVSVWEFFWPLVVGARLVLARPEGHKDPAYLAALLAERRITTLHFVPSMLAVFLAGREAASLGSVRRVFASGEALTADLVADFAALSAAELYNLYGPTEAAIDVSHWPAAAGVRGGVVPIGKPIANLRLYVLGRDGEPLPVGVAGELSIAGVGLARGYLAAPRRTAERFVPDAFAGQPGARRYRSGDLARFRPDGNLEYRGRLDHQVKLRGQRIELGEIEAALAALAGIRAAVVVLADAGSEQARLVAYVVAEGETPTAEVLRRALAQHLPEAMVPTLFVPLAALPLTSSGKVDRKALPAAERGGNELSKSFAAPATELEKRLAALWRSTLGRDRVGIHDSFFELGGHSLLLARVQADLASQLGLEVSMVELFQFPTIALLARHLEAKASPVKADSGRRERASQRARQRQGALVRERAVTGKS